MENLHEYGTKQYWDQHRKELDEKEKIATENKGSFIYEPCLGKANAKIEWSQNIKNKIGQTAVKQGWWVWYPSLGLWEGPFRTVKTAKAKADEEITAEGHAKKLKRSGLQEKQPLFA